ncbi:flagellar basal body rod C-terminal domain-containing protein [Oscillospiraceae bacterium 44-34]
MAVIGTFGSFTAARLGIYASQASLNLTGNNIANINTKGYTRQRLDLVSLHAGGNSRYHNSFNQDIGYGVLADGASQLRDPFMDIRYRNEQSSVGAYEARLKGLEQLSNILDEVGDGEDDFGIIEAQLNDLIQQLQILSRNANDNVSDTNVRSSAESLVDLFNSYSKALVTAKDTLTEDLKDNVDTVNTILTQIRDLNVEIREAGIHGDKALELRDHRNVLIDELSSYVKIDVRYDLEKIDEFSTVERLNISIAGSGNPPIKLIQGVYGTQISMPEKTPLRNPKYPDEGAKYIDKQSDLTVDPPVYVYTNDPKDAIEVDNAVEGSDENRLWMSLEALTDRKGRVMKEGDGTDSQPVDLGDNALFGSLQSMRELLTEEGEFASKEDIAFDPKASIKRGIPYYQHALDALARKFAETLNEANAPAFAGYETELDANGVELYKIQPGANCDLETGGGDAAAVWAKLQAGGYDISYLLRTDLSDLPEDLRAEVKIVQEKHLSPGGKGHGIEKMAGGNLFSNSGDGDDADTPPITAGNISIAKKWSTGEVRILNSRVNDGLSHSTDSDNIRHMITLMGTKMDYFPQDIVPDAAGTTKYFNGTFQAMLGNTNHVLATDQKTTSTLYSSYTTKALSLDNERQSVSGVDLNEEASNMMQYQKSYAAACQLMTTLDSMLDKLINGTIR